MVIVIRATQALLILFAVAAAVTAFSIGLATYDDIGSHCYLNGEGELADGCALVPNFAVQASTIIAMALAGIAATVAATALNGMARKQGHQPQPTAYRSQPGPMRQQPQQPQSGPMPQQQYYQQPTSA